MFVGPLIVLLARRLGPRRFLLLLVPTSLFLAGVLVATACVRLGWAPHFVVSDKYKRAGADDSNRVTPKSLEVKAVEEPKPDWLRPYVIWMQDEGEALKQVTPGLHVGVGAVSHTLQGATTDFVWTLRANPGFELDGRAFRVTGGGLIQPLKQARDGSSINFDVPRSEEDENLYAVVVARWTEDISPAEIKSTFESVITQGR